MRVLALPGSLRRGSYNRLLLEAAAARAPNGVSVQVWGDLSTIPLFSEDLEAGGGPDGVRALRDQVRASDGVLVATPEYNQSIPGVLKNAIDWLSRPAPDQVLAGKPIAIAGASTSRWGTRLAQGALRQVLGATESLVMPAPTLFVREAARVFDASGRLIDPGVGETLENVLAAFAAWMQRQAKITEPLQGAAPRTFRSP